MRLRTVNENGAIRHIVAANAPTEGQAGFTTARAYEVSTNER
jgi:hypothetical protein